MSRQLERDDRGPCLVIVLERADTLLPAPFLRWFTARGWSPRTHQLELLAKARDGRSVLLIAPTGGGKTLAGFLPSLVELHQGYLSPLAGRGRPREARSGEGALRGTLEGRGLHTLYISPL